MAGPTAGPPSIYDSLGVRTLINCQHVTTQIGGSLILPEVNQAMEAASRHFVQLDELMEAVGKRIAELMKAEAAIVTSGAAAAMTHATAACVAGADPEKLRRLPDLAGMRNEVLVPRHSRNLYDQAIRMVGVTMVEIDTLEKLEAGFTRNTAMVYVLGGPNDKGPFGLEPIARAAARRGVPVLVDAAAEDPTVPNVHLQRGATLVCYSGGKVLRGPQCAGILIGRKDLVKAAWIHAAPHHAFGRPMKVGKEEILGMLAAVEMWFKRDHAAEWRQWEAWLAHIASRVTKVPGVTTEIVQPKSLTGNCPVLHISWDASRLGITGNEVGQALWDGTPRIVAASTTGDRGEATLSTVAIRPLTMMPGEDKIVGERLYALLSNPPKFDPPPPKGPPAEVAGQWLVHLRFAAGEASHRFLLEQRGSRVVGRHDGEMLAGELSGSVQGKDFRVRSAQKYEAVFLRYEFVGTVRGDTMTGSVDLGEYGDAQWTARRYAYLDPSRFVAPPRNR